MTYEIVVPHNGWLPREHQFPLWDYLQKGGKRAIAIWHRRAGKDEVCLHNAAVAMVRRPANYWHMLPEFEHGRRAIWEAINPHTGKRRIDEAFPPELRASTNASTMSLRLINGSTWSVVGSDRYDATMGASAAGITYSEYALANPSAWAYHRPMLEENDGWAVFITTPRGHNHAKTMFEYALGNSNWFAQKLTVDDTHALTDAQLTETLAELQSIYGEDIGRAQFRQELYCDFSAAILGAFYSLEMQKVREEDRIQPVEPVPGSLVNTAWDIGVSDSTAIWFWQAVGAQVYVYDCIASSGVGVEWYRDQIARIESERGWSHGTDFVPHDAKVKEWGSGKTRVETMQSLGLRPMLVPMAGVDDGINAARRTLPLCVFHPRCEGLGIAALEQYRREWDDERKAFKPTAYRDWTTHPADAFRYLAMAWRPAPLKAQREPKMDGWRIPPPVEVPRRGIRL